MKLLLWCVMSLSVIVAWSCAPKASPEKVQLKESPTAQVTSETKTGWEAEWERMVKGAKKEGRVVVYGPPIAETRIAITGAFEKAFPGVTVDYTGGRSSEQAPKITAELRAGLNIADIHIGGTTTILTALREYAAPLKSLLVLPEASDARAWLGGKLEFSDDTDEINLVFAIYAPSNVIYNTGQVNPGEITSFWDIAKPKWNGKIIMRDPRTAGGGLSKVTFWYLTPGLGMDYVRAVAANKPVLTRDNRLQVESVARGKYSIAIAPSLANVFEFKDVGAPIKYTDVPKEGTYASASTGTVMVMNKAPHPNAAALFLNWLLTKEGQSIWTTTSGYPSRRLDTPTGHVDPAILPRPGVAYLSLYKEKYVMTKDEIMPQVEAIFTGL